MEKFIEKNRNQILLLIVILVIVLVAYKSPGSDKNKGPTSNSLSDAKSLELVKQCKIDSQKNLQEDIDTATREKNKSDVSNCFYEPPIYIFNNELNTCLYYGGYSCELKKNYKDGIFDGLPAQRWSKQITDVYTNKTLVDVYIDDSTDISDWESTQIDSFWNKYEELGFE